ncbi:hypothetical protein VD0002_g6464 [Verticillium dahliae]|uniref:Uncharacterized protein n=1 Tax=Verticillium dahliae TaxID=27337 RepID=A0A2J8FGU5_VERDA|nr:Ras-related protein Rab-6A [Verticillium dahliae VDG2]PNH30328.1 hypothetical protein BJF96_g6369 [Verticillium dahliae]PNH42608.1 hypothetical protein VD0004_g4702 [Verticillium dahliae]PNH49427.1 hypothetical protein VD0003_g7705 [Verticillium dahliae]PNH61337.1 hypothetical protein VD0002_g6464 [Verticillium dahliae]
MAGAVDDWLGPCATPTSRNNEARLTGIIFTKTIVFFYLDAQTTSKQLIATQQDHLTMGDADEYTLVPPPWTLKGTVYLFAFWTTRSQAANPPSFAYSPLEASAGYATPEGSRHLGGLSMIQLIRYTESPVGPYDELILSPGFHEYTVEEAGRRVKKRNARITRIYVSQRQTCWNGRKNWNIPKHLAAFDWQDHQDGSTTIKVYPHDTEPVSAAEASPSKTPFFQTTFRPTPFVPSFPISMSLFKHLGVDATLVQPPLPQGQGSHGELPGTDRWCAVAPDQSSRRSSIGWFDLRQTDDQGNVVGEHENFWPGFWRWHLGVKMEDAEIGFGEGKYWDAPKSLL